MHYSQTLPAEELACGYDCEGRVHGQMCVCDYLAPHSQCIEDGYAAIAPRSMALQHGESDMGVHFARQDYLQRYHQATR